MNQARDLSQRQEAILALVDNQGFVATEQLVEHFKVTPQTIRRDINLLCDKKLLERFHGGAGKPTSISNQPYDHRLHSFSEAKHRIAQAVAAHIPNGSSLFLNIGTTTEMVAQALTGHRDLRIVTNNLHVAAILSKNDSFDVMIAGGQLRKIDGGITGPATTDFISQFRLDYGIIGVSGIDEDGSLLDFDYQETRNAQAIIAHSRETILACDHSKFGRRAMTRFGHLSEIDRLFTDQPPPPHYAKLLIENDVSAHVSAAI
ncbi:DeoR family transcriptional regulator [Sphingorhabdus arenilitoris]|uniref:DeoR family transcriptional regulator n=1 Tax=Sphingorhabdus arenilitoris TaxID=1490041 RepID=A0ABV8RGK2_9SPHN